MLIVSRFKGLVKSSLLRDAGTYGFFSLLNSSIPFFLLPILTRYMSPVDYGYVAIFSVMVSLIKPFICVNVHGGYSRAFFAPEKFESEIYLGTVVTFVVVVGFCHTVLFWVFQRPIGTFFKFPYEWVWIVPLCATSTFLLQIAQVSWQVRRLPRIYGLFQNGRTLSEALFAIFFVVILGMGWQGRVFSRTAMGLFFCCLGFFFLSRKKSIIWRFNKKYLFHALLFGFPLIPHSLSGIINTSVDRVFISHMVGIADTGIYTVGYQVGTLINILATSFNNAYTPWLFRKLNSSSIKDKNKIVAFSYFYFIVITFLALFLGSIAPFLMKILVGSEFIGSSQFIIWIALGYAFHGMYYMVVNYIFYVEKTYLLAIATFSGALTNIVLNYFFINYNGAIGAAQATAITHLLTFLLVWFLSSRVYPMPWFSFWKKEASL